MAQLIEMPNGDKLEFPDGMPDGEMQSAIFKEYPQYAPKPTAFQQSRQALRAQPDTMHLPTGDSVQLSDVTPVLQTQQSVMDLPRQTVTGQIRNTPTQNLPEPLISVSPTGIDDTTSRATTEALKTLVSPSDATDGMQQLNRRLTGQTIAPIPTRAAARELTPVASIERVRAESSLQPFQYNPQPVASGIERYGRDIAAGELGSTGSLFDYLGAKTGLAALSDVGKSMGGYAQAITPRDQKFADRLASGVGSFASFYLPGLGVAKVSGLLKSLPLIAQQGFGAGSMAALESAMEAGSVYDTLKKTQPNLTEQEIQDRMDQTFWLNLPVIFATDKIAFFNNIAGPLAKGLTAAGVNAGQEAYQQGVSDIAQGQEFFSSGMIEPAIIGGIIGGGAGAIQGAVESTDKPSFSRAEINKVISSPLPETSPKPAIATPQQVQLTHEQVANYRDVMKRVRDVTEGGIGNAPHVAADTLIHENTTASLASALAKELDLPKSRRVEIALAALVHDAGKIAVPNEVLMANRPLTAAEFELVKTHPVVGHEILLQHGIPESVAEIVLHHHENNLAAAAGSYPEVAPTERVSFGSQIVHVADVVSSVGYPDPGHPYVKNAGLGTALDILENSPGKFNPDVVEAFKRLLTKDQLPRIFKSKGEQNGTITQTVLPALRETTTQEAPVISGGSSTVSVPRNIESQLIEGVGGIGGSQPQEVGLERGIADNRAVGVGTAEKPQRLPPSIKDRRHDEVMRKLVSEMTHDELRQVILTDHVTGLANRRAYTEAPKQAYQASIDVDSLKWVNDNLGHAAGDQLLQTVAASLAGQTPNAFHISGDEFIVQGKSPEELHAILRAAQDVLKSAELSAVSSEGKRITMRGIGFSYGVASDLHAAEELLQKDKSTRQEAGLRAGRGEIPDGVIIHDSPEAIQTAAHEAATSPLNNLAEPTQAQKEAGNYKKGHISIAGLNIAIENPAGSIRSGVDSDGETWNVTMPAHYGYVNQTIGADKDQVDVYVGNNPASEFVFIVNQVDANTGKFDEHKVMLGFNNLDEALTTYRKGFSDGRGNERIGSVTSTDIPSFKLWLKDGNTKIATEKIRSVENAIQKPSTGEILQREPQEVRGARSKRGRMEPIQQRIEPTQTIQTETVPSRQSTYKVSSIEPHVRTLLTRLVPASRPDARGNKLKLRPAIERAKELMNGTRAMTQAEASWWNRTAKHFEGVDAPAGQAARAIAAIVKSGGQPISNRVKQVVSDYLTGDRNVISQPTGIFQGQQKVEDVHPANTLSVTPTIENEAVYHVTAELVKVGKRRLPEKIITEEDAALAFSYMPQYAVEHYDAIVTDVSGKPLAVIGSFKGAIAQTSVFPSTVLLELGQIPNAAYLWTSHNHPSGNTILSTNDIELNKKFISLLDRSGIQYRGLFAFSRHAKDVVYRRVTESGRVVPENIVPLTSSGTKLVSIVERMIAGDPQGLAIESPRTSMRIVPEIAKAVPGLVVLSHQNTPVGFIPVKLEEIGELRKAGRMLKLINALGKTNAGAAIIANPNNQLSEYAMNNVASMLNELDVRPLDAISYEYNDAGLVIGNPVSGAENGTFFTTPVFFSKLSSEDKAFETRPARATTKDAILAEIKKEQPGWTRYVNLLLAKGDKGERGGLVIGTQTENLDTLQRLLDGKTTKVQESYRVPLKSEIQPFADLSGTDLSGGSYVGKDLQGANLAGANLRNVDFMAANLNDANLSGAALYGADFSGTQINEFTKFDNAQLSFKEYDQLKNLGAKNLPKETIIQFSQQWYYSQLQRAIKNAPDRLFANGKQVKAWLESNAPKLGVKKDELFWTGIGDWLETQGRVSKSDVLAFVESNGVQVQETTLGEGVSTKIDWTKKSDGLYTDPENGYRLIYNRVGKIWEVENASGSLVAYHSELDLAKKQAQDDLRKVSAPIRTKFESYQLPGGNKYRELLLTLPTSEQLPLGWTIARNEDGAYEVINNFGKVTGKYPSESSAKLHILDQLELTDFRSQHYNQPNLLAHIRFNERTDAEGKRVLFIEELQSDWGQKGKKVGFQAKPSLTQQENGKWLVTLASGRRYGEYTLKYDAEAAMSRAENFDGKIPQAPFVTDTKAWTALALKRMIAYAAQNGFDSIAWTTGEQQGARYDLSKQIGTLAYRPSNNTLRAYDLNGNRVIHEQVAPDKVQDYIGKDAAQKLLAQPLDEMGEQDLSGENLKIGGEGMKGYYDQIVPQVANELLRKIGGGKVESISIEIPGSIGRWEYRGPNASIRDVFEIAGNRNTTAAIQQQLKAVAGRMQTGESLASALEKEGSYSAAEAIGGNLVERSDFPKQQGFSITPELKAKVLGEGLPLFSSRVKKTQGFYAPELGVAFINSDNVTSKEAVAIILHEMTHSADTRGEMTALGKEVLNRLKTYSGVPIYNRVLERMQNSGQEGNAQEALNYLVEEALQDAKRAGYSRLDTGFFGWLQRQHFSLPKILKRWIAAVRAALYSHGKLKAENLTVDDMIAVAVSGMKDVATGKREAAGIETGVATREDFHHGKIKSLLDKTNWAILTAENPQGKALSSEENRKLTEKLKSELRRSGYSYLDVSGKYGGNEEHSFAILDIPITEAQRLGKMFNQESVLTRKGLLYQDGTVNPATGITEHSEKPEDFYSKIVDTGTVFTVDIDFDKRLSLKSLQRSERESRIGLVKPLTGVHFSNAQRNTLLGSMFGTGIKGVEGMRIVESKDTRLKTRVAFYVDEGQGVFPEGGLGKFQHSVKLDNLYDGANNPLKLQTKDFNAFESAVLDAGFDGYYVKGGFGRQGSAVVLGEAAKAIRVAPQLQKSVTGDLEFTIDDISMNPSASKLGALVRKSSHKELRGLLDDDGNLHVWDAFLAIHQLGAKTIGIPYDYRRRVIISLDDGLPAFSFMDDDVSPSKLARYLGSDSVLFPMGGKGYVTGIEYGQTIEREDDILLGKLQMSQKVITGDTGRTRTPDQLKAFESVGRTVEVPTVKERMSKLWHLFATNAAQGLADQFAPVEDISHEAYRLLRQSKGSSGAFATLLEGGQLKLVDQTYAFDASKKGGVIDRLLIPLQGEADDFLWWVAANRAERLISQEREHLFTPQNIVAMKTLASGTTQFDYKFQHGSRSGQVTRNRVEIYTDALATFNEYNKNVLDMAEQSSLIDKSSRPIWEHEFYVPFYRVDENDVSGFRAMNIKSGVVRQQAFKHLKGGTGKLNTDLLENTLLNWSHLLDAAAKNRAAKASLEAAEKIGVAHLVSAPEKNSVWFMEKGQKQHFVIDDPAVFVAITSLEYAGMRNLMMNAMSSFKHVLTVGVTASPFFKIRNLIRDSVHSIAVAPLSYNPAKNLRAGYKGSRKGTDAYYNMLASGGTIHFGTMLEGNESKRVRALVESGVDRATILDNESNVRKFYKRVIEPSIAAYNELGNAGETINRSALYEQLIKQGVSHGEAAFMARDLLDFSMQGAWTSVRFLSQVVPFLNARIQGMYRLGKGVKQNSVRASIVLGAVSVVSIALLMAYKDDDDWKKREDWDRDTYWWFKVGGIAYRVPKPFEIGAIASLAERGVELRVSDEMTGERFGNRLKRLVMDNLSMNPIPQAVKPLLDVYANKDSFTGRPIESESMENLEPSYRYHSGTTMAARGAAKVIPGDVSPVQIDHLIRGYFGWLGSFVVQGGDILARPLTDQPVRPAADPYKLATGGMIAKLEGAQSRYVTQMYEQALEVEQVYATYRSLAKSGKRAEAEEYGKEHKQDIAESRMFTKSKAVVSKLNARIRTIERDEKLSAEEKRKLILDLQARKEVVAKRVLTTQRLNAR